MHLSLLRSVLIFFTLSVAITLVSANGHAKGKALAASCVACHGEKGVSNNALWPNLAGQKEAYLVKQMKDFRSGARKDPMMTSIVLPLSDEDIAALAKYYANLK